MRHGQGNQGGSHVLLLVQHVVRQDTVMLPPTLVTCHVGLMGLNVPPWDRSTVHQDAVKAAQTLAKMNHLNP